MRAPRAHMSLKSYWRCQCYEEGELICLLNPHPPSWGLFTGLELGWNPLHPLIRYLVTHMRAVNCCSRLCLSDAQLGHRKRRGTGFRVSYCITLRNPLSLCVELLRVRWLDQIKNTNWWPISGVWHSAASNSSVSIKSEKVATHYNSKCSLNCCVYHCQLKASFLWNFATRRSVSRVRYSTHTGMA